jgi:hypothetical protein
MSGTRGLHGAAKTAYKILDGKVEEIIKKIPIHMEG